jgi:hypothetical protein
VIDLLSSVVEGHSKGLQVVGTRISDKVDQGVNSK